MALDDGRVVSNFMVQSLQDQPLTLYGDGSQTRSFCYVQDLVRGLLAMMDAPELDSPVNLGNPYEITVKQLGEEIFHLSGTEPRFEFRSLPEDDPRQRQPDISKAQDLLEWIPLVPLRQGLERTLEDFRSRLSQSKSETQLLHQSGALPALS
jgi:UDP-glucuronate decarboxylase